jgi:UDP-N-acetylmuramate--alanine ligase
MINSPTSLPAMAGPVVTTVILPGPLALGAAAPGERRTVAPARRIRRPLPLTGMRIHFVGIGGSGMSGLARLCKQRGSVVTGTDQSDGPTIEMLSAAGIHVTLEQTAEAIPGDCELVVISAAIKSDHPEVVEARRRGVRIVKYARMLGDLMLGRTGISIAGTHGKSSTTSMTSHILIETGADPSFIVGANCRQIGGGFRCGSSDILVAEACEYDRSFHHHRPTSAVILNIEEDHLDYYKNLEEIIESFADFARKLPAKEDGGFLLINHEMPHRLAITASLNCDVETIGFAPQADWQVEVVKGDSSSACGLVTDCPPTPISATIVRLHHHGEVVAQWRSPLPGDHMCYNAAAAAVLSHRAGASWDGITRAIESFHGLDRRMQLMGVRDLTPLPLREGSAQLGVTVVDDYGHHPTEVETTLRALRRHYNPKRLICVFQPHQHSRTRFLLEQFAASFAEADLVIVPHIYFVRDSKREQHAVKAADLVDRLRQRGKAAMHLYPFEAIIDQLDLMVRPGDLVVTMGAGDVWRIATSFLKK